MIAIKDMEMPKSCSDCNITTCKGKDEPWNYVCSINLKDIDFNETERAEHCPLVEIQEPKTGHWILTIEDWNKWTCSECGFTKRTDIHVKLGYNYCSNCGAKMEGEKANEKH